MTSRNSSLTTEPFLLKPAAKDYLWGGTRLNDDFAKGIDLSPLAETWECSTHPDGPSMVASGVWAGLSLPELLKAHPELLGARANAEGELPILIKLIDAHSDLSVQVHPSDDYAAAHENGQRGKSEMWYVLDAAKDATLVYGFQHSISPQQLRQSVANGTVEHYLQRVPIRKNDVFYIEAGTVHAIGAGALIAEIQENSNLTYRLYDYNRTDKAGNLRPLHLDKALEVANLKAAEAPRQPMRTLKYTPGCATELLCRCKYFQAERMLINTEICHNMAAFASKPYTFQVLLCVDGCGVLFGSAAELPFFKGDCIFVPAGEAAYRLHGQAQLLRVSC